MKSDFSLSYEVNKLVANRFYLNFSSSKSDPIGEACMFFEEERMANFINEFYGAQVITCENLEGNVRVLVHCPKEKWDILFEEIHDYIENKLNDRTLSELSLPEKEAFTIEPKETNVNKHIFFVRIFSELVTPASQLSDAMLKLVENINANPHIRITRLPDNENFNSFEVTALTKMIGEAYNHIKLMICKTFPDVKRP